MKHLILLTAFSILIGLSVQSITPPMFQASLVKGEPVQASGSAELKPSQTMEEAIGKAKHWEIIMRIWKYESDLGRSEDPKGLHIYCKSIGKTNELGYGGIDNMWCYDSFDDVVGVVDDWFTRKLDIFDLSTSLCIYGGGGINNDCGYYRKYKLLD